MKIISCNILAHDFYEPKYYPLISSDLFNRDLRFKIIIDRLLSYNADIILLQEVMEKEYNMIKTIFNNYNISKLVFIDWNDKPVSGNVILTKYNIIKFKELTLSNKNTPKNNNIKCPIIFTDKYIITSIHLSDTNNNFRIDEIKTLLNYLNKFNKITIIGGDFNEIIPSELHRLLEKHNYITKRLNKFSYMIEENILIDFIYIKKARIKKYYVDNDCFNYNNVIKQECQLKKYGTDHNPIIMIL